MDAETVDSDVAWWIIEFLIRQPLTDAVFASLLRALPLSNHNISLKKSLLLRSVESEVSNGAVSEKILTLLEQIEELDYSVAVEASDALKAAYCAVAVDCTVRYLGNDGVDAVKGEYFDAVKRIWTKRVGAMEKFGNVGLVSEGLWEWKDELESALWNETVREKLARRKGSINAVEFVRVYVDKEKGRMGQSFLEILGEKLEGKMGGGDSDYNGDAGLGVIGLGNGEKSDDVVLVEGAVLPCSGTADADANANANANATRELPNGNVMPNENKHPRRKHVARKSPRIVVSGASKRAKNADVDGTGVGPSQSKYVPTTPEVDKVQEMLESSRLELQEVVKDPLPDALLIADDVVSGLEKETRDPEPVRENQNRVDPCDNFNARGAQQCEGNVGNACYSHQTNALRPSLMERNNTAHTIEWDDSLDVSSTESSNHRPYLSSPKKRPPVSPLKTFEVQKVTRRRKNKRWSSLEEDTLRAGIKEFGVGKWKPILDTYRKIFEERTEVDLKDKWRNMTRLG